MKVIVAQPGTQHAAQIATQLSRLGYLFRYHTGFAFSEGSTLDRIVRGTPNGVQKALESRRVSGLLTGKLRTHPVPEAMAWLQLRLGGAEQSVMEHRNRAYQTAISDQEIAQSEVVIGFDTSSWILVHRCHRSGKRFVLDQTIGHGGAKAGAYTKIRAQFPEWANDLEQRNPRVSSAEADEHHRADRITVASSFTKGTLEEHGVRSDKIVLNPYGVDLERFSINHRNRLARPVRFLFAGLVCARKGIPILLKAWEALNPRDAELLIAGPITPTAAARLSLSGNIKVIGKVSNTELARIMSESDVFVFPSYFEGFGLVILEAMASGLPVITTTATAGPDIITPGEEGWVIEPGDLDALVEAMRFCLNNRDRVAQMGINARRTAEKFSWDAYGERWAGILAETLEL